MSKTHAFARFQNFLLANRKENKDPAFVGCDEVLSFISEKNASGNKTRITDLVQYLEFGTGPTVHRKCNLLEERGFVKITVSDSDKRSKVLTLTKKGEGFLEDHSKLMIRAIKETA